MKRLPRLYFLLLLTFVACRRDSATKPPVVVPPAASTTFTNPLFNVGPDPWVVRHEGWYYYTFTTGRNLTLLKNRKMSEVGAAPAKIVWTPPATGPNSQNIWAPELHRLDNKWYLIYTAGASSDLGTQRLWVLENSSPDPTEGTWTDRGRLFHPTEDFWAIDGTVLEHRGKRYLLWSGYVSATDITQRIYISEMSTPWTLTGPRRMLSSPELPWEILGSDGGRPRVNEGPQVLKKGGKLFIVYSASGCWTDDYALGMLTLNEPADPMDATAWRKSPAPVFVKNPAGQAYGPGHNSFFQSVDGTEDWILYHANPQPGLGCSDRRSPRMQKITWRADGTPEFGTPEPLGKVLARPSGE